MEWLLMEQWSPYAAGIGIGVLSWFAFLFSDKPLACSTTFVRTSGMVEKIFRKEEVMLNPYYRKFPPAIDWQFMLVLGIVIGAFLSAEFSGQFRLEWVPAKWEQAAGASAFLRWVVALAGGIFMGLGSRWGDGCTSGHGISGALQLAVSSWLAALCFFAGGIAAAMVIFKVILA
jgi:uncharacterized membrane protein YedE/YeeE